MNRQYSFVTQWQIAAPLPDIWQIIYESEQWPFWWKEVKEVVEIEKGDEQGIGSIRRYTLVSPTGYRLRFQLLVTERIDLELLRGIVSGDLEGVGSWHFRESEDITFVECRWEVATTVRWMNLLAPILKPFFRLNHSIVMRNGAKRLAERTNAKLISC